MPPADLTAMRRVNVIGLSGSGKSYVARAISAAFGLPHIQLDALSHGPNWTDVSEDEFVRRVRHAADGGRWVMDGNYLKVRPLIWSRADTVIWTDLDKGTVMRQVIWRSLRDWAMQAEPIPGNRERLRNFIEPWHPIRWAWSNHAAFRKRERDWLADAAWQHLRTVHLRSPREIDAFIKALGPGSGDTRLASTPPR